jgi:hypothetical protein
MTKSIGRELSMGARYRAVKRYTAFVRLLRFTALGAALLLSACSSFGPDRACTLIGCSDGLTIRLASSSPSYKIEVLSEETGEPIPGRIFECSGACPQQVFFNGLMAARLTIRVTTAAGSRITGISNVEYRISRPNGPGCPPECLQATVVAELPP